MTAGSHGIAPTKPRLWVLSLALLAAPAVARQPEPVAEAPPVVALDVQRQVEETLFKEERERYRELELRRRSVDELLARLYQSLREGLTAEQPQPTERIDVVIQNLGRAEAERAALLDSGRILVDRMRDRLRRMELLDLRLAELRQRPDAEIGVLTGTWEIVLMPLEQRGTFTLVQSGTLISGTYRLDGGFSGSLQGTLVNRKVYLVRIDSRLGKSMELEGYLSGDGAQIRGSWLSYELADGEGSTGDWSARRRSGRESR